MTPMPLLNQYLLTVLVTRHREEDGVQVDDCGILMDLIPAPGSIDEDTPGMSILESLPSLFEDLMTELDRPDYVYRVDVARQSEPVLGTPRQIERASEVSTFLQTAAETARDRRVVVYPVSVWILPKARRGEAELLITEFRENPFDGELFRDIGDLGVQRVAVFRSSITLSVQCANLEGAIAAVRAATHELPVRVDWS